MIHKVEFPNRGFYGEKKTQITFVQSTAKVNKIDFNVWSRYIAWELRKTQRQNELREIKDINEKFNL